jgi:hypothetical protein
LRGTNCGANRCHSARHRRRRRRRSNKQQN